MEREGVVIRSLDLTQDGRSKIVMEDTGFRVIAYYKRKPSPVGYRLEACVADCRTHEIQLYLRGSKSKLYVLKDAEASRMISFFVAKAFLEMTGTDLEKCPRLFVDSWKFADYMLRYNLVRGAVINSIEDAAKYYSNNRDLARASNMSASKFFDKDKKHERIELKIPVNGMYVNDTGVAGWPLKQSVKMVLS